MAYLRWSGMDELAACQSDNKEELVMFTVAVAVVLSLWKCCVTKKVGRWDDRIIIGIMLSCTSC